MRKHLHPRRIEKAVTEPPKKTALQRELEAKVNWRKVIQGHLESQRGRKALTALLSRRHKSVSAAEMARDQAFIFNLAEIAHSHEKSQEKQLQRAPFTMNMLFDNRGTHHTEFSGHFSEAASRLLSQKIPTTPRRPTVRQIMAQRMGSKGHASE